MIKKDALVKFIDKYTVGDAIKAVVWKVVPEEKSLKTRGELDGRSFVMAVTLKEFTEIAEAVRVPVRDTAKMRLMLSPFGADVSLSLHKQGDRLLGLTISNPDCESFCASAEISAIPPVTKDLTDNTTYEVVIPITEEFVSSFLKARKALSDVEEFTVRMNKNDVLEFVLGQSTPNADRIALLPPLTPGNDKLDGPSLTFPIKYFVKLLDANKEMDDGKIYICSRSNVLKVVYSDAQFECMYWQFARVKK